MWGPVSGRVRTEKQVHILLDQVGNIFGKLQPEKHVMVHSLVEFTKRLPLSQTLVRLSPTLLILAVCKMIDTH